MTTSTTVLYELSDVCEMDVSIPSRGRWDKADGLTVDIDHYQAGPQPLREGMKYDCAIMMKAQFTGDMRKASFRWSALVQTRFLYTDLRGVSFYQADLGGTQFIRSDLRGADFRGADFRGAVLNGVRLEGADLRDAYGIMHIGDVPVSSGGYGTAYFVKHRDTVMVWDTATWCALDEWVKIIRVPRIGWKKTMHKLAVEAAKQLGEMVEY